MKRSLILINPVSGGRAGSRLKESLAPALAVLGLEDRCDIRFTPAEGPTMEAGNGEAYACVIVAGGDGTVARVVQDLARLEKKPPLGIIPLGTGNDLARVCGAYRLYRHKGLPTLLEALLNGSIRPLDLFCVNDKIYFTNYCGIGIDAKISNDFNLLRHGPFMRTAAKLLGSRGTYGLVTMRCLSSALPFPVSLEYHDRADTSRAVQIPPGARQVLVTAIPSYAAGARPSDHCRMDDGCFEVTVAESLWQWFALHMTRFIPVPLPRLLPSVMQFQAAGLTVSFTGSTCFQADGELYDGIPAAGKPLIIKAAGNLDLIFV